MSTRESVSTLYRDSYSAIYEKLYVDPWPEKHQINLKLLQLILRDLPVSGRWLDICCGQAWHFSHVDSSLAKIGVDLSESQLQRAAAGNPAASFICADVGEVEFQMKNFTLVTSFWGAYCYLDDEAAIIKLVKRAISWTEPGGAVYLEVLPPESLASFNASPYAARTGFRVAARTPDYRAWSYEDYAGVHLMKSPPLNSFISLFQKHFARVNWIPTGFMVNLVGRNRRVA